MEGEARPRGTSKTHPHVVPRVISSGRHRRGPTPASSRRPSGFLVGLFEQYHVFSRVSRLAQHRPILYLLFGTLAGMIFLPLILILFFVCGSIGFTMLLVMIIEGGFFLMAVLGLISSLFLPFLAALPFAAVSFVAYQSSNWFKSFMWNHFRGPIRQYYSLKRRFENAIASFRGDPAIDYPRAPPNYDNNYDGRYGNDSEEEVVLEHYERQQSSQSIIDEWRDIRRRFSEGVPLHGDTSDHMGVGESASLYMADFMNHLFTLVMFCTFLYLFVQAVSPATEAHYY